MVFFFSFKQKYTKFHHPSKGGAAALWRKHLAKSFHHGEIKCFTLKITPKNISIKKRKFTLTIKKITQLLFFQKKKFVKQLHLAHIMFWQVLLIWSNSSKWEILKVLLHPYTLKWYTDNYTYYRPNYYHHLQVHSGVCIPVIVILSLL